MLVTGFRPASLLAAAVAHALGEDAPLDVVRRLDRATAEGTLEVLERLSAGDLVFRVRGDAA